MLGQLNSNIGVWILLITVTASYSYIIDRHGVDGSIESPEFPKNYPNNVNVTWRTYGPLDAISLSVTILQFDIYNDSKCSDFLKITQDYNNSVVFRGCGTLPETNFIVLGNKMLVTFISDGKNTGKGFKMRWKVRDYRKENKDPIVVIERCLQTSSPVSTESKLDTASENPTEMKEEQLLHCQTPQSRMPLLKDFIIGALFIALVGVSTISCVQCKKRTRKIKRHSYNAISSVLSDNDLPSEENMEVLRRALSSITRSTISEDPIYDNVLRESDYMNTESLRRSQSYIDVDELEEKAMYINFEQMQNPPSENFKNILKIRQEKIGSKKSSTLHPYIDVIGELEEPGAVLSNSLTSGYSKPNQNFLMQFREALKIPKSKKNIVSH